jgi:hypothetical protein
MMDIVVAKYNEDVSWIDKLNKHNVLVYNKDSKDNRWKLNLLNYGKDAETHLYHIVNNYNNLADYTVFLQGNPFDHWANTINDIESFNKNLDFLPLGPVYERDNHEYQQQCRDYCNRMDMNYIEPFYFIGGMQLILSKNQIQSRSKEFYLNLKNDIPKIISQGSGVSGNSNQIWHLEYTWPTVFNINEEIKKSIR